MYFFSLFSPKLVEDNFQQNRLFPEQQITKITRHQSSGLLFFPAIRWNIMATQNNGLAPCFNLLKTQLLFSTGNLSVSVEAKHRSIDFFTLFSINSTAQQTKHYIKSHNCYFSVNQIDVRIFFGKKSTEILHLVVIMCFNFECSFHF